MKKILPLALALLALASCAKKEDAAPAAPTIVGTWMWTGGDRATITKSNGATTHTTQTVAPNTSYATYGANGSYQFTTNGSVKTTGTYTLIGTSLTISSGTSVTSTVSELTANRLVLTSGWDDVAYRYESTDVFSR